MPVPSTTNESFCPVTNCSGGFVEILHAAAFSYRPVQRGQIDLKASIKTLFEGQILEGVLHLFTDDRTVSGVGESEFLRGACWIAPISTTTAEGSGACSLQHFVSKLNFFSGIDLTLVGYMLV